MSSLIPLFIFMGIPLTLGWIYRANLNHQRFMKVLQLKADMNAKLLDRAGADPGLLEFLKSDAQQQLFDVRIQEPRLPAPYMRMLTSLQISLVLLAGGVTCLVMKQQVGYQGDREAFLFFGTLGVSLGIGALLSAVAAGTVAKMWHSLNDDLPPQRSRS